MRNFRPSFLAAALALAIAGCTGGGDDSSSSSGSSGASTTTTTTTTASSSASSASASSGSGSTASSSASGSSGSTASSASSGASGSTSGSGSTGSGSGSGSGSSGSTGQTGPCILGDAGFDPDALCAAALHGYADVLRAEELPECALPLSDAQVLASSGSPSIGCGDGGLLRGWVDQLAAAVNARQVCIDTNAAAACANVFQDLSHELPTGQSVGLELGCGAVVPQVPQGGPCTGDFVCADGRTCVVTDVDQSCGGTCQDRLPDGAACDDSHACARDALCSSSLDETNGGPVANDDGGFFCRPKHAGEECDADAECPTGMYCEALCATPNCPSLCEIAIGDGGNCAQGEDGNLPDGGYGDCAQGLTCSPDDGLCHPTQFAPAGARCTSNGSVFPTCADCVQCLNQTEVDAGPAADGGTVVVVAGTCVPLGAPGSACASDSDCEAYVGCADAGFGDGGGACAATPGVGQRCADLSLTIHASQGDCQPGLSCARADLNDAGGTCVAAALAQPFGRCGSYDVPDLCDPATSVCTELEDAGAACVPFPAAGEPCIDQCAPGLGCLQNLAHDGGYTCAPYAANGPCDISDQCGASLVCNEGTCAARASDGDACEQDFQCQSGYCSLVTGTCAERCLDAAPTNCSSAGAGVALPAFLVLAGFGLRRRRRTA